MRACSSGQLCRVSRRIPRDSLCCRHLSGFDRRDELQAVALVSDQLQQLIEGGQISAADASPIRVSIDQARQSIANGNLTPARNQLNAARNKVEAAVNSGKITAANAAALLAMIDLAVAHM